MAILKSSIAFALAAALIFSVARACEDQPELDQQCRRLPDTHPDYDLVTCVECSLTCGGSLTPTCVSVHACGWCTNYPRTTLPPSTVTGPTGTSSMQPGETSSNGTIGIILACTIGGIILFALVIGIVISIVCCKCRWRPSTGTNKNQYVNYSNAAQSESNASPITQSEHENAVPSSSSPPPMVQTQPEAAFSSSQPPANPPAHNAVSSPTTTPRPEFPTRRAIPGVFFEMDMDSIIKTTAANNAANSTPIPNTSSSSSQSQSSTASSRSSTVSLINGSPVKLTPGAPSSRDAASGRDRDSQQPNLLRNESSRAQTQTQITIQDINDPQKINDKSVPVLINFVIPYEANE